MIIAQVIPLTQSIDTEALSYFSAREIPAGTLVTVPLRSREIRALVLRTQNVTDMKSQLRHATYQIRNILKIHDEVVFSESFLETCNTLKSFYATTTGRIIHSLSPQIVTKNLELFVSPASNQKMNCFYEKILGQNTADRIIFYKTLVREKMLRKESVHIVCPTKEHAQYIYDEISGHISEYCFIMHSGISAKKIKESHITLREKKDTSIVISTPRFLDIYQYQKNTIIIEQESSEYYFTIASPFIDMRIAILNYAQNLNIQCIWADTIIRPETWYRHKTYNVELIEPFIKRIFKPNDLDIINQNTPVTGKQTDTERIAELSKSKEFQILDEKICNHIKKSLEKDQKIFLFVPKKSLAPSIVCKDCGNIARSPETGYPLSLYVKENKKTRLKERILMSQATGESFPAFDQCQFCKGYNIIQLGIGTQRVHEYIEKRFPNIKSIIADGDTIKTKKQKDLFQNEYASSKKIIIIGTQKAISLLSTIDTSIIVSLDTFFGQTDYSMSQKVLGIITSLREKTLNKVFIQSRNILDDFLPLLKDGLYIPYIEQELNLRREYNYPPSKTIFVIKKYIKRENFKKTYSSVIKLFQEYNPNILTQPSRKKGCLELIIILEQDKKSWNQNNQNQKLCDLLQSFGRTTEVRINPTRLN